MREQTFAVSGGKIEISEYAHQVPQAAPVLASTWAHRLSLLSLLSTIGTVNGADNKLLFVHLSKGEDSPEALRESAEGASRRLLFDESGKLDDLACVPSGYVSFVSVPGDEIHLPYAVMRVSPKIAGLISDERKRQLSEAAGIALVEKLYDYHGTSGALGKILRVEQIPEVIGALTDGKVEVGVTPSAIEWATGTFKDYDDAVLALDGIHPSALFSLIEAGACPISETEQDLLDKIELILDISRLWEYACSHAGVVISKPDQRHLPEHLKYPVDTDVLRRIASVVGMHDLVDALLSGVDIDDIMA